MVRGVGSLLLTVKRQTPYKVRRSEVRRGQDTRGNVLTKGNILQPKL
jgi:hypothetical protein